MIKLYLKEDPTFRTYIYTFLTPAYIVISPLRALLVQKTDMLSCLATRRSLANLVLSISIPQTIYQSIKQIRYEGNLTPCISLYALSRILVFAKYFKGEKRFLVVNKDHNFHFQPVSLSPSSMACSGIAEHNEARRKAGRAELLAYRKKELMVSI